MGVCITTELMICLLRRKHMYRPRDWRLRHKEQNRPTPTTHLVTKAMHGAERERGSGNQGARTLSRVRGAVVAGMYRRTAYWSKPSKVTNVRMGVIIGRRFPNELMAEPQSNAQSATTKCVSVVPKLVYGVRRRTTYWSKRSKATSVRMAVQIG